jgi:hypothetical protein
LNVFFNNVKSSYLAKAAVLISSFVLSTFCLAESGATFKWDDNDNAVNSAGSESVSDIAKQVRERKKRVLEEAARLEKAQMLERKQKRERLAREREERMLAERVAREKREIKQRIERENAERARIEKQRLARINAEKERIRLKKIALEKERIKRLELENARKNYSRFYMPENVKKGAGPIRSTMQLSGNWYLKKLDSDANFYKRHLVIRELKSGIDSVLYEFQSDVLFYKNVCQPYSSSTYVSFNDAIQKMEITPIKSNKYRVKYELERTPETETASRFITAASSKKGLEAKFSKDKLSSKSSKKIQRFAYSWTKKYLQNNLHHIANILVTGQPLANSEAKSTDSNVLACESNLNQRIGSNKRYKFGAVQ